VGRKHSKKIVPPEAEKRSRWPLMLLVVGIYFATVVFYILCLTSFDLELMSGPPSRPNPALIVLWGLYYFVPFILAVVIAGLFRPFWKTFRDVLVPIFYLALVYSFLIFMLRSPYAEKHWNDLRNGRLANMRLAEIEHVLIDGDQNGRAESVRFTFRFNLDEFPPGKYRITGWVEVIPGDQPPDKIGAFIVPVSYGGANSGVGNFDFDIPAAHAGLGREYDLQLQLHRIAEMDKSLRRILALSRWSPFFRTTSWDGEDPELHTRPILLDTRQHVDFVTIPAHNPT